MKTMLLAAALFGEALSLEWSHHFSSELLAQENLHGLFQSWRFAFSKTYESMEEEVHRFTHFEHSLARIAESNDRYFNGDRTYLLKMNQFGDLSDEEFYDQYNCPSGETTYLMPSDKDEATGETLPEGATVDWAAKGYAMPVKYQEACGSCWAFSAVAAMECNHAIAGGQKTLLSEQQLVDCSWDYGNKGCQGGWYFNAWQYVIDEGGICSEADYAYTAKDGQCKSCANKHDAPKSFKAVSSFSESALSSALDKGCVSVAVQADQFAFRYYSEGILDETCGASLNHAITAVGYGVLDGQQYWIVKNSWDTTWGQGGFAWICKSCHKNFIKGQCGINSVPYTVLY